MSPDYAMDGIFSVKSDVFSFGVLVLEIISGKKNRGFYSANKELNLLGHVCGNSFISMLLGYNIMSYYLLTDCAFLYCRRGSCGKKKMLWN